MKSLDDNTKMDRVRVWLLTICFSALAFAGIAAQASAGPLEDVPAGLADALDVSTDTAKLILSLGIIISASLVIAVVSGKNANPFLSIVVIIGLVGLLVSIGWIDAWLLMLIVIIVALMFSTKIRDWVVSAKGG